MEGIISTLLVGLAIGFIASLIMKKKQGIIRNIITGVVGSFVGHWLANYFGIDATGIMTYVISVAGSCIVIFVLNLLW